jgi:diaminopimelate decarboxylase
MKLHFLPDGEPHIGGIAVSAMIAHYGTPLFVYDSSVMHEKWSLLRRTLPCEFAISYSVKANPNPAILRFFLSQGCGLEIASGGEFFLALQAGGVAQEILFAGPGKTEAELEYVLAHGIGEIHAESLIELERISLISRKLGERARVALRINPSDEAQGGAMRMGGKPGPFGLDEEMLDGAVDRVLSDPALDFCGIHLFSGTQILDHAVLLRQYRKGIALGLKAARRLGHPFHTLDFGGGLGIPYFSNEKPLNMDALRDGVSELMSAVRQEPLFSGTRFMLEPGRYLVGEAGIYVTRIIDKKESRGKIYLVLDGGMNHHLAASGNLGQVIKRNFPVAILNKKQSSEREIVDLVGPLCTPLDVLARDVELPKAEVDDLVAVFQSGAYARTASPLDFLSHPHPAEVLVSNGRLEIIRSRGTFKDLVADLPGTSTSD